MTDETNGFVVTEPIGPNRTLTDAEATVYAAELGSLGYSFAPQGEGDEAVGFRVEGNGISYDYRYRENETAVELMDRIVIERGG